MPKFDLLIKSGFLVDPASNRIGNFDLAISDGRVARVEQDINPAHAKNIFDAHEKLVLPGLIDTHVHLTPAIRAVGFKMLARAGVTCALDCSGLVEDVLEGLASQGAGISVAVLNRLDPGKTISGPAAPPKELRGYLDRSLASGAIGLKLLGGHLPLSPETTTSAIEIANQAGAYVAFHCGSTLNGSNLNGFLDALAFTGNHRLHICHVNAYCRGLTLGSPVEETMVALGELQQRPHIISESHMATYNSCWSRLENGVPRSHVTRTCLEAGGFEVSAAGLLAAARNGYLRVHKITESNVLLAEPEEGVRHLEAVHFDTMVSFPVNRRSTAFLAATRKNPQGRFVVSALSTDGGGIPRNFLLTHGLSLVRFDALSLSEFVTKCCWTPARMLGLTSKGHLSPGADGDLVVVDPEKHRADLTVAGGSPVAINGIVTGSGGTVITTERGQKALKAKGVPFMTADLSQSLLYSTPE